MIVIYILHDVKYFIHVVVDYYKFALRYNAPETLKWYIREVVSKFQITNLQVQNKFQITKYNYQLQLMEDKNNLEERTYRFSVEVIKLLKSINDDVINKNIKNQLIISATSIGANYIHKNSS